MVTTQSSTTIGAVNPREAGLSLIELSIALSLMSILIMAYGVVLIHGMEQRRESDEEVDAIESLRNVIAEVDAVACEVEDHTVGVGIGAIYGRYNGQVVTNLDPPGAQVTITCFPDESTIPTAFGGPQDLNFDGDANDDLGNESNGTDLKLVPVEFVLDYQVSGVSRSITVQRLFTKKTD